MNWQVRRNKWIRTGLVKCRITTAVFGSSIYAVAKRRVNTVLDNMIYTEDRTVRYLPQIIVSRKSNKSNHEMEKRKDVRRQGPEGQRMERTWI